MADLSVWRHADFENKGLTVWWAYRKGLTETSSKTSFGLTETASTIMMLTETARAQLNKIEYYRYVKMIESKPKQIHLYISK